MTSHGTTHHLRTVQSTIPHNANSTSQAEASTDDQRFCLFLKLPLELQLAVWKFAIIPNCIEVKRHDVDNGDIALFSWHWELSPSPVPVPKGELTCIYSIAIGGCLEDAVIGKINNPNNPKRYSFLRQSDRVWNLSYGLKCFQGLKGLIIISSDAELLSEAVSEDNVNWTGYTSLVSGDEQEIKKNIEEFSTEFPEFLKRCMSSDLAAAAAPSPRVESMPYMYKYSTEAPHAVLEICEAPAKNSASSEKQVRRTVIFELYRCGLQCDNAEAQEDTTQLDVKLCSELLGRLGTPKINYSGSIEAMDLMATWSSQCLQGHPRCAHRNSAQRLPTRVLDLGPASPAEENGSYLRLMSSNGRRARYACLSYRWSSLAQQYRTTRQNYHEHLCNIAIQRLPQTFRDAIKLVRHLGLRYLWIDCLCIIQDDDDDWERECGRMASIFEHSFITISALSAKDSTSGLFHRWNTFDAWKLHIQTRDGTQIGLRGEQSTLKGDLENSSMSLRGWILQEKILSPALAHFGHTQIHWECITGTTSELRATYLLPTNSPLKYFLHESIVSDFAVMELDPSCWGINTNQLRVVQQ
ncbi:hypothetical protein IFR04_004062 [Cadophora malorum]|uniref:Heterokaryon incompatibility domain-containing protein n=1 Tax=Cadophora malorum TaxID=108018 RepID=A0A8H8BSQ9_9HELO|nr:hypothetical protein IFR04_004062 [Cadophora malorum]